MICRTFQTPLVSFREHKQKWYYFKKSTKTDQFCSLFIFCLLNCSTINILIKLSSLLFVYRLGAIKLSKNEVVFSSALQIIELYFKREFVFICIQYDLLVELLTSFLCHRGLTDKRGSLYKWTTVGDDLWITVYYFYFKPSISIILRSLIIKSSCVRVPWYLQWTKIFA